MLLIQGSYIGKLLVALSKDANNNILPVAYAIVDNDILETVACFLVFQDTKECPKKMQYPSFQAAEITEAMENSVEEGALNGEYSGSPDFSSHIYLICAPLDVEDYHSESCFDVVLWEMDWLSQHKAVIVCHKKVVEIPVEDGRILRVHGERAVGITKALKSAKEDEPKLTTYPYVPISFSALLEMQKNCLAGQSYKTRVSLT
ncbi:hypothetical protein Tco_0184241 [Tanacetum coccineum]